MMNERQTLVQKQLLPLSLTSEHELKTRQFFASTQKVDFTNSWFRLQFDFLKLIACLICMNICKKKLNIKNRQVILSFAKVLLRVNIFANRNSCFEEANTTHVLMCSV